MRLAFVLPLLLPATAFAQNTAPDTVLWYSGNGGTVPSTAFSNYIPNSLNGTYVEESDWANVDLSSHRFVILGRPSVPFTVDQVADLQAYIDDFGILVIAGESNEVGANHITHTNALLTDLDLGMQLQDTSYAFASNTSSCDQMNVTTASPFFGSASPPSISTMGSIELSATSTAQVLVSDTYPIDGVPTAFRLAAAKDLVLLTADFSLFGDETCGEGARLAFWDNLWDYYCDRDDDGAVASACGGFDCDDTDPLATSVFTFTDADGDGFGDPSAPSCEDDAVTNSGDCDDSDPDVNPDNDEVCDGEDNDCDGDIDDDDDDVIGGIEYYPDLDGDGWGRISNPNVRCEPGEDEVDTTGDCLDSDDTIHPEAEEICGNNTDDDCDGETDETCGDPPTFVPPTGGTTTPSSCGCTGSPVDASWMLLGLVGLLGRRRRQVC